MNTNRIIGVVLILIAVFLGFNGIQTISESSASVEILDAELSVSDEGSRTTGFLYLGLGVLALFGGISLMKRK